MMESLENRQLLAGGFGPINGIGPAVEYDGPRNIGTVSSFRVSEQETVNNIGLNDSPQTAQFVPLGTGAGQRDTIDVTGTNGFIPRSFGVIPDVDFYRVSLRAGDILDVATQGATTSFTVLFDNGQIWFGVDDLQVTYPAESPLQTLGNAAFAQVVPRDGDYFIAVAADAQTVSYTMGLRAYRPISESLPVGQSQKVFLDFDGGLFPAGLFSGTVVPVGGLIRVPTLQQTLNGAGVLVGSDAEYQAVKDMITATVIEQYATLGVDGTNGDFLRTGIAGDYGVQIFNSDDHPDPGNDPTFTRVTFGSDAVLPFGGAVLGIAESVDVGNFKLDELTFVFLDIEVLAAAAVPRSAAFSELDVLGLEVGATTAHELAHLFGARHTDGTNNVPSLIDGGGAQNNFNGLGVGPDGILGTADDQSIRFRTDVFDPGEGIFGTAFSPDTLAHGLSTGTRGGSQIGGRVFEDVNRNGVDNSERGLAGVTVFADIDGDRVQDASEPSAVTGADGGYSFTGAISNVDVYAIVPANFEGTTAAFGNTVNVVNRAGVSVPALRSPAGTSRSFGFFQLNPDATGRVFETTTGEGIPGIYVYADLDGDNLPDLGEPFALSNAQGNYQLDLTGLLGRAYSIRINNTAGLEVISPPASAQNEHPGFFVGTPVLGRDFQLRSSRDYGDAPDTYQTSRAAAGPSHGLVAGLRLGATIDREANGVPTPGADGDDRVNSAAEQIDDEDGVVVQQDLVPGQTASFAVDVVNSTGQTAYLQTWVDFDGDGTFNQPNNRLAQVVVNGTGTQIVSFTVPTVAAGTQVGETIARFRYSLTPNLAIGGAVDSGEVEDHAVSILFNGNVVNDDEFTVTRNPGTTAYPPRRLDVLANDRNSAASPLTILAGSSSVNGTIAPSGDAPGQQVLLYTPRPGFVGVDRFTYTVRDSANRTFTANVTVNVTFQSDQPIAVDDVFRVPSNETAVPLNVLENDIGSIAGGITIASAINGTAGGRVSVDQERQSITYTPAPGFRGSEQFRYTVQDSAGGFSTATVTIVLTPQADNDDTLAFSIRAVDPISGNEIRSLQAGDRFDLQVSVDDLRALSDAIDPATGNPVVPQGVFSAFLDLLYTSELVRLVDADVDGDFDVEFGPRFAAPGSAAGSTFFTGDGSTPGLINEIGSTQPLFNFDPTVSEVSDTYHVGPAVLFTLSMEALRPGVAIFQADPSDSEIVDSALINFPIANQEAVEFAQQRFGSLNLTISPSGDNFPTSIDDAFHDGRDSRGQVISPSNPGQLRVLDNDLLSAGTVVSLQPNTLPSPVNGTVRVVNNQFIEYTPAPGFQGFDEFTYAVTVNSPQFGSVTTLASVSLVVGAIQDPLAEYSLVLVDEARQPILNNRVTVGQRFGIQVVAEDLQLGQNSPQTVFSGFLDLLYNAGILTPTTQIPARPGIDFNFDVDFRNRFGAAQFNQTAAVGVNSSPGIIDEFGSVLLDESFIADSDTPNWTDNDENNLATIFFVAGSAGTTTLKSSPADRFPQQETTINTNRDPVPISRIIYNALTITVASPGSGEPIQNLNLPADVNGDGFVTARDALLVINEMTRLDLSGEFAGNPGGPQYYLDVDGNGRVSAVDALRVINYLNMLDSSGNLPSGESIVSTGPASSREVVAAPVAAPVGSNRIATETVVAAVAPSDGSMADGSMVDASTPSTATDVAAVSATTSSASKQDDDDSDWLGLLADDVAGVWS